MFAVDQNTAGTIYLNIINEQVVPILHCFTTSMYLLTQVIQSGTRNSLPPSMVGDNTTNKRVFTCRSNT
jgi:Tat protein secretion system quality control protein TatD with DNase activity